MKVYLYFLASAILILISDIIASGNNISFDNLVMDVMPSAVAVWWMVSVLAGKTDVKVVAGMANTVNIALVLYYMCSSAGHIERLSGAAVSKMIFLMAVLVLCLMLYGVVFYVWDVKNIMKNGTQWTTVCLIVDMVYFFCIMGAVASVQVSLPLLGLIILCGMIAAVGVREHRQSQFVLWERQERLIVESMKITSMQSASAGPNIDELYKEIYDRVVEMFESKQPYLDNNLTINDLVKELYTNKLYISRAISRFTGRNFCQFVNFYRIIYAVQCFRDNPELKIHELADMSGFNSIVSFSMAFRLFMNENPGEWTRKERNKLMKAKKLSKK